MKAQPVKYHKATIEELDIFYREAGPKDAPTILLLHGYPTSSHMFRNLIPLLSDTYHVIAPDLPGFGFSAAPHHKAFDYTFDNITRYIQGLIDQLALQRFALYVFDYGAPVGYRLAVANPNKIDAIISQNGNAYLEGLSDGCGLVSKISGLFPQTPAAAPGSLGQQRPLLPARRRGSVQKRPPEGDRKIL
jgi:pimeloyl-ACP methyl ester carboxylesterase